MKLELGKSWMRKLEGRIERYEFEVGVLEDKPHKLPVETPRFSDPILGSYNRGPVRKTTRENSGLSIGQVLVENMKRMNINVLQRPFQEKSSEIMKFTEGFLKLALNRPGMNIRRVENLLQAIVRNPIFRQEYGGNSSATADAKGFDRLLIDTGQTVKAIRARAKRV